MAESSGRSSGGSPSGSSAGRSGRKPDAPHSRVPQAVGAIPVVGDLVRGAEAQAQWMQEMLEQNARLVGQFPATMRTFNDSLERFNQTVQRLDRAVTQIETATRTLVVPLERIAAVLDPKLFESLRKEALPALRAATDTQRQVARLQGTVERVVAVASELPGAGILRRLAAAGRDEDVQVGNPKPPPSGR